MSRRPRFDAETRAELEAMQVPAELLDQLAEAPAHWYHHVCGLLWMVLPPASMVLVFPYLMVFPQLAQALFESTSSIEGPYVIHFPFMLHILGAEFSLLIGVYLLLGWSFAKFVPGYEEYAARLQMTMGRKGRYRNLSDDFIRSEMSISGRAAEQTRVHRLALLGYPTFSKFFLILAGISLVAGVLDYRAVRLMTPEKFVFQPYFAFQAEEYSLNQIRQVETECRSRNNRESNERPVYRVVSEDGRRFDLLEGRPPENNANPLAALTHWLPPQPQGGLVDAIEAIDIELANIGIVPDVRRLGPKADFYLFSRSCLLKVERRFGTDAPRVIRLLGAEYMRP